MATEAYFYGNAQIEFPDPRTIDGELIGVGGNLHSSTLIAAYKKGIFPWYSDDEPLLWWSLDPRFVIFPHRFHVSKSLVKRIRKGTFSLSLDRDFDGVMACCAQQTRPGQNGTWITNEMRQAYGELHRLGYAHSVETWKDGVLVGGLYGVSLGGCFYGESMFARVSDASKVAFAALLGLLEEAGFGLVDCQQHTRHLGTFGAIDTPRNFFLDHLERELEKPTIQGNWNACFPQFHVSTRWQQWMGEKDFKK
ncbi:MAG: leucyl/phenylalanyl-tRNA--protein transferase [Spirochaetales bacterium]|nr:leucyl/phenylalanyl-tRNA--protein transferase [Spirochaetales bacterium]